MQQKFKLNQQVYIINLFASRREVITGTVYNVSVPSNTAKKYLPGIMPSYKIRGMSHTISFPEWMVCETEREANTLLNFWEDMSLSEIAGNVTGSVRNPIIINK